MNGRVLRVNVNALPETDNIILRCSSILMDYKEAIEYLYSVRLFGTKLGLANTKHLLRELGHPEDKFFTIHVAGTNGKGSVCALIGSILSTAGYKVGLFTSPHILSFRERIRIGNNMISSEEVCHHLAKLFPVIQEMSRDPALTHPTFFEIVTALAVDYFAENDVDIAVVETGMGGRLDATNALPSQIQVITTIGLEHTAYLGTTLEEIAFEKAGIIKEEATVIVGEQQQAPLDVIRTQAAAKKAKLLRLGADIRVLRRDTKFPLQQLDILSGGIAYSGILLPLLGRHQAANCCLAVAAAQEVQRRGFAVPKESMHQGIRETRWPGRFEVIAGRPNYILDAACNPHACVALAETLSEVIRGDALILIAGFLRDKDYRKMCEILFPMMDRVILTEPKSHRALPVGELREVALSVAPEKMILSFDAIDGAIACASRLCPSEQSSVSIAGSNYLLGPARKALGLDDLPDDFILSDSLGGDVGEPATGKS